MKMSQFEWSADDLNFVSNWETLILESLAMKLTHLRACDYAKSELFQLADDADISTLIVKRKVADK